MASKSFILLALALAVVLLISSPISAAKDLDDSKVEEDAKYDSEGFNDYNRPPEYRTTPPSCSYGCCGAGGNYNGGCRCCSTSVEATAYKQAHEAQTHN